MRELLHKLKNSLIFRLIFSVGLILMISAVTWAYFSINYQREKFMDHIIANTDRFTNTIKLGTHYAMMLNSRDDINQIIQNIGRQKEVRNIRIYNKEGKIKYSNQKDEVESVTNIKDEACYICHKTEPPADSLALNRRTRIFRPQKNKRFLGIISPIYNEPGCSTDDCHVHPQDKKVLGALDVVVSLDQTDRDIGYFESGIIAFTLFVFVVTSVFIFMFIHSFVIGPIRRMIAGTKMLAKGDYDAPLTIHQTDEMGQLAGAIAQMGKQVGEKQEALNKQRDEYQDLFEMVPCIITVQDPQYRLIQYNREFSEKFDPKPGDFCYCAYKGRTEKCVVCPVERTFEDGQSHYSEERGITKDGIESHWLVRTSPITNEKGEVVAAMEMSLDITRRKQLEEKLEKSEKKYYAIFNNIPNPVFVLDVDSLQILDCNESVTAVYGYDKEEIIDRPFTELFLKDEKERFAREMKSTPMLSQVRHIDKEGGILFVNIRISPSEYPGKRVLLVTTSDITKRLEAEQQLIQASKMATLGEMATGVAHELNQPLAVIKTASSYFMRKVKRKEKIADEILLTMSEEVDSHVDRATKIINHMRQFGRKDDMTLEKIRINDVLERAFEIFKQQLKVRGIEVIWQIDDVLPTILGDPGRLEQVFINLLINARDAIEEKWQGQEYESGDKCIRLSSRVENRQLVVSVCDTGMGIPKGIIDRIFEPFFTTKKVGKGTGLGLSISYGIIKDCGGEIKAVPNKGGGGCFVITFPVKDDSA